MRQRKSQLEVEGGTLQQQFGLLESNIRSQLAEINTYNLPTLIIHISVIVLCEVMALWNFGFIVSTIEPSDPGLAHQPARHGGEAPTTSA
jgi:hypothetical protein